MLLVTGDKIFVEGNRCVGDTHWGVNMCTGRELPREDTYESQRRWMIMGFLHKLPPFFGNQRILFRTDMVVVEGTMDDAAMPVLLGVMTRLTEDTKNEEYIG